MEALPVVPAGTLEGSARQSRWASNIGLVTKMSRPDPQDIVAEF
jgi:hypothetical protein